VKAAVIGCVEGAKDLFFDAEYGEVVVEMQTGLQPFSNLSDGQRCMLAMVGDMAQKAAKLNRQFGSEVLQRTQGVVLIDELDLHLHPRWQRRIIEDLRRAFPKMQFVCTTHSPFLIQSIRQGQLIQLDEQDTESLEYENQSIEDIAEFVQGVKMPQSSQRAVELDKAASRYYSLLQDSKSNREELAEAEAAYKQVAKRYSANPGLAAILDLEAMARSKEG
jgi:predicted ATP-binding protein involved in virulence